MGGGREAGIAGDAGDYEDLADVQPGIAEDSASFAGLLEESSDEVRGLDSPWLYRTDGVVFGPVPAKEILELLYAGEIDADTPVAPEDGEFQALRRFGGFRAHLDEARRTVEARQQAEARARAEAYAQRSRRLRWTGFALIGLLLGSVLVYGIVRWRRSAAIAAEKARKEQALERELALLLEGVTIEPPLMPLVEEPAESKEPKAKASKRRRRSARRQERQRLKVSRGRQSGTLSSAEVMGGVQQVFGGLKTCIKGQLRRDPRSIPDTIVLTFAIDNGGSAKDVRLKDRFLRRSPMLGCVQTQLRRAQWRSFEGEVRNVEYPITVRRPE